MHDLTFNKPFRSYNDNVMINESTRPDTEMLILSQCAVCFLHSVRSIRSGNSSNAVVKAVDSERSSSYVPAHSPPKATISKKGTGCDCDRTPQDEVSLSHRWLNCEL